MIGIDQIATISAVAALAAGAAWGGYHYREIHLVEFQAVKAEYLYDKCQRECLTVCKANKVPVNRCDCSHCERYLEGK
jgi:hypothetical protein